MSRQALEEFMARVQNDEALKQELQALGTQASQPLDAVIAFAASKGYDISVDDVGQELTDRELDAVAGGLSPSLVVRRLVVPPPPNPVGGLVLPGLPPGGTTNPSDRRLKSNITRVGTHALGIGLYEYDIFGRRERGVMADEVERVKPQAVSTHVFGIKMVDYGSL
jgi:predicted ribosomally synthesized peptide with nif11-like leader